MKCVRDILAFSVYLLLASIGVPVQAQLSPGPLTKEHQMLEGTLNCTQCHDLGNQVPDQKCLHCHSEIDVLIDANRGLHANEEVRSQLCIDCHSEHHGRTFDMMRFDEANFDHLRAGYVLEGMHALTDCRQCHQPDNISDSAIRQREDTYLGLNQECLTCHEDFHQGTLPENCLQCHDFQDFRPAPGFDHSTAQFPLRGAHTVVNCAECHPISTQNGRDFQHFVGVEFSACTDCHIDPHNNRIPSSCTTCHSQDDFNVVGSMSNFNHELTGFELKGAHDRLDCASCHDVSLTAAQIFTDRTRIEEGQCISCHNDVHEGRFGTDCTSCHNEESFLQTSFEGPFDHDLTDFPLVGMHTTLDCNQCHITTLTDPVPFRQCTDCHEDYHGGEFANVGGQPSDCRNCHSVEQPFSYTSYTLNQHQESSFPLVGGHLATPCFSCHLVDDEWTFRNIGSTCVDCHDNIHEGHISPVYYPEENCSECHHPDAWSSVSFEHDRTGWPLEESHAAVSCRACHFTSVTQTSEITQQFTGMPTDCYQCHQDPHRAQFESGGFTDCAQCHSSGNWEASIFDHNNTQFPLVGRHNKIDCHQCHIPDGNDSNFIYYKIERFSCIDCHL